MNGAVSKILLVDDEPFICELLSRWLTSDGYECSSAHNGEDALKALGDDSFQLIVSDIMMPGMSGIDLLTIVRKLFPDVAVIMATAVDDRKTGIMTLEIGAYGYIIKPFDRNEISINVANALERRRLTLVSREYEHELEKKVMERTTQIREREEEIILRLLSATGFRDDETGAHVKRIGLYSAIIAKALGWPSDRVEMIRLAAPMHDVGKIGIPDRVLLKPGRLTPEEFEIMKQHAEIGASILSGSTVPLLQMAQEIAWGHHERHDGSGYPRGLSGHTVPPSAAICAVVDVYDALVNNRVYRPALPENEALSIMIAGSGEHYGPEYFDCFLSVLPELRRIRDQVQD